MKRNSVFRILSFVFSAAPGSYAEMVFYGLLNCLAAVANVWAIQSLFEKLPTGFGPSLVLYGVLLLLSAGYSVWYIRYRVQFSVILDYETVIRTKLHRHSQHISNEVLETPDAFARIKMADNAKQNLFRYGEIWIAIGMAGLQAFAVTGYLSAFQSWFLILLPLAVAPVLLEGLYAAGLWKKDQEAISQSTKEETTYTASMTDSAGCKETRLTGGTKLLLEKWNCSRKHRNALEERQSRKTFALRLCLLPVQMLGNLGGFLVSAILLYRQKITLAEFTAGVAAYSTLMATLQALMGNIVDEVQWRNLIAPFFWYWDLPQRTGNQEKADFSQEIRLDHASFRYAGQSSDAIHDISLTIQKGEVIAIVGENGAGKTTLANLLLGLYLPTEGDVLYDGLSTSQLKEGSLHKNQSAVMQSFARYKLTVGDNIRIADFHKKGAVELGKIFQDDSITEDTRLGKEFGGRELSGGQWQQLSCARGFWKSSSFVVLDEATSAIDPLREKAMYDLFRQELAGKTGILITHRLGAVSMADRIIVLSHGAIVQDGTHEELLAQGGLYADLWASQAVAYESNT